MCLIMSVVHQIFGGHPESFIAGMFVIAAMVSSDE